MTGGFDGPELANGTWVVPAPPLGDDGKPRSHRAPYPPSVVHPASSGSAVGAASRRAGGALPGIVNASRADAPQFVLAESVPVGAQTTTVEPPAGPLNGAKVGTPFTSGSVDSVPQQADGDTESAAQPPAKQRSVGAQRVRSWAETIAVFAIGLVLALVLRAFLLQAFSIPSDSMVPTLVRGDRVVVWKPTDTISDLNRGDVVVFKRPNVPQCPFSPEDPEDLIKRVIGLPGEVITSPDGKVLADDVLLDEGYLPTGVSTAIAEPITVPEGQLLMLGDNRGGSKDGRCFGPISEDAIVGRATARVWPPGRIGGL